MQKYVSGNYAIVSFKALSVKARTAKLRHFCKQHQLISMQLYPLLLLLFSKIQVIKRRPCYVVLPFELSYSCLPYKLVSSPYNTASAQSCLECGFLSDGLPYLAFKRAWPPIHLLFVSALLLLVPIPLLFHSLCIPKWNCREETQYRLGTPHHQFNMDLRIGDKYRIGRKIGSGSFGEIYLGECIVPHFLLKTSLSPSCETG